MYKKGIPSDFTICCMMNVFPLPTPPVTKKEEYLVVKGIQSQYEWFCSASCHSVMTWSTSSIMSSIPPIFLFSSKAAPFSIVSRISSKHCGWMKSSNDLRQVRKHVTKHVTKHVLSNEMWRLRQCML